MRSGATALFLFLTACGPGTTNQWLRGAWALPAIEAIRERPVRFEPKPIYYRSGHPELRDTVLSHRLAVFALADGVTVGQVNAVADAFGGKAVGATPGISALTITSSRTCMEREK